MVMEAVAIKVSKDDERLRKEAEKKQERDKFKQDVSDLEQYR